MKNLARTECSTICINMWAPVCGTDGETYSNIDCLESAKMRCNKTDLSVIHVGVCDCHDPCPDTNDPVCGTDGVTYPNQCLLERQASKNDTDLTFDHKGECEKSKTKNDS